MYANRSTYREIYQIRWIAIHLAFVALASSYPVVRREYCEAETFTGSCSESQVLLIRHALYGRMKLGRCVIHDYGYVGCQADVSTHLDAQCSGNRTCRIHIPDAALDRANPCPKDFKTYLEVSYECITVQVAECATDCGRTDVITEYVTTTSDNSVMSYPSESGYVFGHVTDISSCQARSRQLCPIILRVSPGQTIQVSLWELDLESGSADQLPWQQTKENQRIHSSVVVYRQQQQQPQLQQRNHQYQNFAEGCHRYAVIHDAFATSRDIDVCGRQNRTRSVYTSIGNELHIFLAPSATRIGRLRKFLLEYKTIGCPDVIDMQGVTVSKRNGRVLIVRCGNSDMTYHLVCPLHATQWQGDLTLCNAGLDFRLTNVSRSVSDDVTLDTRPIEILIVITTGVAFVMGSTVIAAGIITLKRCSSKQVSRQKTQREYPLRQLPGDDNDVAISLSPAAQRTRYALTMYQSLSDRTSTEMFNADHCITVPINCHATCQLAPHLTSIDSWSGSTVLAPLSANVSRCGSVSPAHVCRLANGSRLLADDTSHRCVPPAAIAEYAAGYYYKDGDRSLVEDGSRSKHVDIDEFQRHESCRLIRVQEPFPTSEQSMATA